jgi:mono/diheme cytochrome c family protein
MNKLAQAFSLAAALNASMLAGVCPSRRRGFFMLAIIAATTFSPVAVPSAMAQSRGELLYATHCISCHTTQMHWRDKRSANNWPSLKLQVRRWQDAASLAWVDSDILDVSGYLNTTIYHFELTTDPVSSASQSVQ